MKEVQTVTFRCRFKRFSTYLPAKVGQKNGKRIRFADGTYRTSDPEAIEFLRKHYRPPMMAEVIEAAPVASAVVASAAAVAVPPGPKQEPFFPGQTDALAKMAAPPPEPPPPAKKK